MYKPVSDVCKLILLARKGGGGGGGVGVVGVVGEGGGGGYLPGPTATVRDTKVYLDRTVTESMQLIRWCTGVVTCNIVIQ